MRHQCQYSLAQTIKRVDKYNMQEFDKIGEDLFNKIRGRFPSITIGNDAGEVINEPSQARFFDFEYKESDKVLGNVSVNITEDEGMTIIFSKDFISTEDTLTKNNWYAFLKELRLFAKKRMLEFSIRDITKSNLTKRDYKFLSNRTGDRTMAESKLYGTSKISYQDVDGARLMIKHTESVNQEQVSGRTRNVGAIYIESSEGERFKYPYKHLNGARAMARHVAEGGNAYDDFGKHIVSLSEEQAKLSKFKRYMSRSAVMAESLSEYTDAVNERIVTVKKTLENLQKKAYYTETIESFAPVVMEDVPAEVAENWIDQLTIRQFNEELKDIFPYVFKLVSEVTKAKELGPDDLLGEQRVDELPVLAIPALMAGARMAIPYLTRMGAGIIAKRGAAAGVAKVAGKGVGAVAKGAGKGVGAVAKGAGKFAVKNPGTTAAIGGGAYLGKQASDAIDAVGDMASDLGADAQGLIDAGMAGIEGIQDQISAAIGSSGLLKVAQFASKYALPALAVVAILYGGKKVIDMLRSKDDNMQTASIESVEEAIKLAEQDCWDGHERVPGTTEGEPGSCRKKGTTKEEIALEQGFEEMMGQFREEAVDEKVCKDCGDAFDKPTTDCKHDSHDPKGSNWVDANNNGIGDMDEDDVDEAYINNAKDATDLLGELRGIGKSFERGQAEMPRGFANRYVSDVWDVYTWIETKTKGFQGIDKNFKSAIDDMMKLRGIAKKKELAGNDDSGMKDGAFGNQVVTVLYPVMQSIDSIKMGDALSKSEDDESMEEDEQKTPLGEFILSYFDKETGQFPKGETAILTMVEKDYGEQYINPAKKFIEQVGAKFEELQMRNQPQQMEDEVDENFTQAAAAASRAHQSEFEYPKGSGKMHPVKMSKGTAHELNDDFDRIRELAGLR